MATIAITEALNLAVEHVNSGRLAEAKSICDDILRQRPDVVDAHYLLGMVMYAAARHAEAEAALREAIRLGGTRFNFVVALADVLRATGRRAEEQTLLRAAYQTEALVLPYLEMDVAYACNLKCPSCTHYSNYGIKGWVDFDEGSRWLRDWSQRLYPRQFRLLGGEPTLNPRLCDYIRHAAALWPNARREVASNGFFVGRHPELFQVLAETGTTFVFTIHEDSAEYLEKANYQQIKDAALSHGFAIRVDQGTEDEFIRQYQGEGAGMMPFADGDPEESFRICINKTCATIHAGLLWKCPPVAFLGNVDKRFKLSKKPEWRPYVDHRGLGLQASDGEILEYVGRHHPMCAMCPAKRVPVKER